VKGSPRQSLLLELGAFLLPEPAAGVGLGAGAAPPKAAVCESRSGC